MLLTIDNSGRDSKWKKKILVRSVESPELARGTGFKCLVCKEKQRGIF